MVKVFSMLSVIIGGALILLGMIGLYLYLFANAYAMPSLFEIVYWIIAGVFVLMVGVIIHRRI